MTEKSIYESVAEGCVCPDCGRGITSENIQKDIAHSIGEAYFQPACPDCGKRNRSRSKSEWYPEK